MRSVQNPDDTTLNSVHFTWGHTEMATVALKVNCLSTEFAAKKHGEGEYKHDKFKPLALALD